MIDKKATQGRGAYELGWDDGYAEGYGARMVDVTELFMPTSDANVEAAADYLQAKYVVEFASRSSAIGLVRGILRAAIQKDG